MGAVAWVWLLLIWNPWVLAQDAGFDVVVHKDTSQLIQLKAAIQFEPNSTLQLPIRVPKPQIQLSGSAPPHIRSIFSRDEWDHFTVGDALTVTVRFTSDVTVQGEPTLVLATGCKTEVCVTKEVQRFECKAEHGKFSLRLGDDLIANIPANTTALALRQMMERSFAHVQRVSVSFGTPQNRVCTAKGQVVVVTFDQADYPDTNGDIPALQGLPLNDAPNPRTFASMGDSTRLMLHERYAIPIVTAEAVEIQRGMNRSNGVAVYLSGDNSTDITFQYTVQPGDQATDLEVVRLNVDRGRIASAYNNVSVDTVIPTAGTLSFNNDIHIDTTAPRVLFVDAENADGTYSVGDDIVINVVFSTNITATGDFTLPLDTGATRRSATFHQIKGEKLQLLYQVREGDATPALEYKSATALLNGSVVLRSWQHVTTTVPANMLLPEPKTSDSLSGRSQITIDTTPPVLHSLAFENTSGLYTGGDSVLIRATFNAPVLSIGAPSIVLQTGQHVLAGSQVMHAPLQHIAGTKSAHAGSIATVALQFQYQLPLQIGDEVRLSLPSFWLAPPATTVRLIGDFSAWFTSSWDRHAEVIALRVEQIVPANTVVDLIIPASAGVATPEAGVTQVDSGIELVLCVGQGQERCSYRANVQAVSGVAFADASISFSPTSPGAVSVAVGFTTVEALEHSDTITVHISGMNCTVPSPNNLTVDCADGWLSASCEESSLKLTVVDPPSSRTVQCNVTVGVILPAFGVGVGDVFIDATLESMGNVAGLRPPTVSYFGVFRDVAVEWNPTVLGEPSEVRFAWSLEPSDLQVGDAVWFVLPELSSHHLAPEILEVKEDSQTSEQFHGTLDGNTFTFTALKRVSAGTAIDLAIPASNGIQIPTEGLRYPSYFRAGVVSTYASVPGAQHLYPVHFAEVYSSSMEVVPGTLDAANSLRLQLSLSNPLGPSDVVVLHVPDFYIPFSVMFNLSVMSSVAVANTIYNSRTKELRFELAEGVPAGKMLFLEIAAQNGVRLPSTGIMPNSLQIDIESNIAAVKGALVENDCVGLCDASVRYEIAVVDVAGAGIDANISISKNWHAGDVVHLKLPLLEATSMIELEVDGIATTEWTWSAPSETLSISIPYALSSKAVHIRASGFRWIDSNVPDVELKVIVPEISADHAFTMLLTPPLVRYQGVPLFSQLEFGNTMPGAITNMTLSIELSVPMAAGQTLRLHLIGFGATAGLAADGALVEGHWDLTAQQLQLLVLQPLDAHTTYAITITSIVLPSTGLAANSSACTISSDDIMLPWTNIQLSQELTAIAQARVVFHGQGADSVEAVAITFDAFPVLHLSDVVQLLIPQLRNASIESVSGADPVSVNAAFPYLSVAFENGASSATVAVVLRGVFVVESGGISDGEGAIVEGVLLRSGSPATVFTANIDCFGICGAEVTFLPKKAGFPTAVTLGIHTSWPVMEGDHFRVNLSGFHTTTSFESFSDANGSAYVGTWDNTTQQLDIDMLSGNTTFLVVEVPISIQLRLPVQGIVTDENMFTITWDRASLNGTAIANVPLTAEPVGYVRYAAFIVQPSFHTDRSCSLRLQLDGLRVPLQAGDDLQIYMHGFSVVGRDQLQVSGPSASEVMCAFSDEYLTITVVANPSSDTSVNITVESSDLAHLVLPKSPIPLGDPSISLTVHSAALPIVGRAFDFLPAVGAVSHSALLLDPPNAGALAAATVELDLECALAIGDMIKLQLPTEVQVIPATAAFLISGFNIYWDLESRSLTAVRSAPMHMGNISLPLHGAFDFQLPADGFYENELKTRFSVESPGCPIHPQAFDFVSGAGLKTSALRFDRFEAGAAVNAKLTIESAMADIGANTTIFLTLPGFTTATNTATGACACGNGMATPDSCSLTWDSSLDVLQVKLNMDCRLEAAVLFPITLPPSGMTWDTSAYTIRLEGSTSFAAPIQTLDVVAAIDQSWLEVSNVQPGAPTSLAISWTSNLDVLFPGDVVAVRLPAFQVNASLMVLEGLHASDFHVMWDGSPNSVLTLTALTALPASSFNLTLKSTSAPVAAVVTPQRGVGSSNWQQLYQISMQAVQGKTSWLPFTNITWIPFLGASSVAFLAPDASAVYFPNPNIPAIQLSWDHALTDFSINSQIMIGGQAYTVRDVVGDVIELFQEYVGTPVAHGVPLVALESPGYRYANYSAGSNSTELVFKYDVQIGDDIAQLRASSNMGFYFDAHNKLLRASARPVLAVAPLITVAIKAGLLASAQIEINTKRPQIIGVSSPSPNGTYTAGDTIDIHVTFDCNVVVNTSINNSPSMFVLSNERYQRRAYYVNGSSTNTLAFRYNVQFMDFAEPPLVFGIRATTWNELSFINRMAEIPIIRASIEDWDTLVGSTDIHIVWNAPKAVAVSGMSGVYTVGDIIEIDVTFDDDVMVEGAPSLLLDVGSGCASAWFSHVKDDNRTLVMQYLVEQGDSRQVLDYECSYDLQYDLAFLQDNGANITSQLDRTIRASLVLPSPGTSGSLGMTSTIELDTNVPQVQNVSIRADDGVYATGDWFVVDVTWDRPVVATGMSMLLLRGGDDYCVSSLLERDAGLNSLSYWYFVAEGMGVGDLDIYSRTAIRNSGEVLRDANEAILPVSTLLPVPGTGATIGTMSNIVLDTAPARIVEVRSKHSKRRAVLGDGSVEFDLQVGRLYTFTLDNQATDCFSLNATDQWLTSAITALVGEDTRVVTEFGGCSMSSTAIRRIVITTPFPTLSFGSLHAMRLYACANQEVAAQPPNNPPTTVVLDVAVQFDRPVVVTGADSSLELLSGTTLFTAGVHGGSANSRVHITITKQNHGSPGFEFQLQYGPYLTKCLEVDIEPIGHGALRSALMELPGLAANAPSVSKGCDQIKCSYHVKFDKPLLYPLRVYDDAGANCRQPPSPNDVVIDAGSTVEFRTELQSQPVVKLSVGAEVAQAKFSIAPGARLNYNRFSGVAERSMRVKSANSRLPYPGWTKVQHGSFCGIASAFVHLNSSQPASETIVRLSVISSMALPNNTSITLQLPHFTTTSQMGVEGNHAVTWNENDQRVTWTTSEEQPAFEIHELTTPFTVLTPAQAVFESSPEFVVRMQSNSMKCQAQIEWMSAIDFQSFKVGLDRMEVSTPLQLQLLFETTDALSEDAWLELVLPEFSCDSASNEALAVTGPSSHIFEVHWDSTSSVLRIVPQYFVSAGAFNMTIVQGNNCSSPRFGIHPSTPVSVRRMDPERQVQAAVQWTPVLDAPQLLGIRNASLQVSPSLDGDDVVWIGLDVEAFCTLLDPATVHIELPHVSFCTDFTISTEDGEWQWTESLKQLSFVGDANSSTTLHTTMQSPQPAKFNWTRFPPNSRMYFDIHAGQAFSIHNQLQYRHDLIVVFSNLTFASANDYDNASAAMGAALELRLSRPIELGDVIELKLLDCHFQDTAFNVTIGDAAATPRFSEIAFWDDQLSVLRINNTVLVGSEQTMRLEIAAFAGLEPPSSVVQFGSSQFGLRVSAAGSVAASEWQLLDVAPCLGVFASKVDFSNPYAGESSDIILKLITVDTLQEGDKIVVALPGVAIERSVLEFSTSLQPSTITVVWDDELEVLVLTAEAAVLPQPITVTVQGDENNVTLPNAGLRLDDTSVQIAWEGSGLFLQSSPVLRVSPIGNIHCTCNVVMKPTHEVAIELSVTANDALFARDAVHLHFAHLFSSLHGITVAVPPGAEWTESTNSGSTGVVAISMGVFDTISLSLVLGAEAGLPASGCMAPECYLGVEIASTRIPVRTPLQVEIPCIGEISAIGTELASLIPSHLAEMTMSFELWTPLSPTDDILVHVSAFVPTGNPEIEFVLEGLDERTGHHIVAQGNASWDETQQFMGVSPGVAFAEARYNLTIKAQANFVVVSSGLYGNQGGWIALRSDVCPAPLRSFVFNTIPMISSRLGITPNQADTAVELSITLETGMQLSNSTTLEITLPGFASSLAGPLWISANEDVHGPMFNSSWNTHLQMLTLVALRPIPNHFVVEVTVPSGNGLTTPFGGLLRHDSDVHPTFGIVIPDSGNVLSNHAFDHVDWFGRIYFAELWFDIDDSAIIWLSFVYAGRLQGGDTVTVSLPGFWTTDAVTGLNSSIGVTWDPCKQTATFLFANSTLTSANSTTTLGIEGLKLPRVGVVPHSGVGISVQAEDGPVPSHTVDMVQTVGRGIDSSFQVTPTHMASANQTRFSMQFSVLLPEYSLVYLELPHFEIEFVDNVNCEAIPTVNPVWDAEQQVLVFEIAEPLQVGAVLECVVELHNNFVPLHGFGRQFNQPRFWVTTTQNRILVQRSAFDNLHELGLMHAGVQFGIFTTDTQVELILSFQASDTLSIGDNMTFHLPEVCRTSGFVVPTPDNTLYFDFDLDWDDDARALTFTTNAAHPSRLTTSVIRKDQGFSLCEGSVTASAWWVELHSSIIGHASFYANTTSINDHNFPPLVQSAEADLNFDPEGDGFGLAFELRFDTQHPDFFHERIFFLELPGFYHEGSDIYDARQLNVQSAGTSVEWIDPWLGAPLSIRGNSISTDTPSIFLSAKQLVSPVIDTVGSAPVNLPTWVAAMQAPFVVSLFATGTSSRARSIVLGDIIEIAVQFSQSVQVYGCINLWLNTNTFASYTAGNESTTLLFTYVVKPSDSTADLAVAGPAALQSCGGEVVSATIGIQANTTLIPPFNLLLRNEGQFEPLRVEAAERATIVDVYSTYDGSSALLAGDQIDIDVRFSRAVDVSIGAHTAAAAMRLPLNNDSMEAVFVPLVREFQVTVVSQTPGPLWGLHWQLDFGAGLVTGCMRADKPTDVMAAVTRFSENTKWDLNVAVVEPIDFGFSFQFRYASLAGPLPAASMSCSADFLSPPMLDVQVHPTSLAKSIMSFRLEVREGDFHDTLNYTAMSSIVVQDGAEVLVMTEASLLSTLANLTLPSSGTVLTMNGNTIRVEGTAPRILAVVPSQLGPLTFGETLLLSVLFDQPVRVIAGSGAPFLQLVVGTMTTNAQFIGQTGAELTFKYQVQVGHRTDALRYASVEALHQNDSVIVRNDSSAYPAHLELPAMGAAGSLEQYSITVGFELPAKVLEVTATAPVDSGEGDFITITIEFSSAVMVLGTPYIQSWVCGRQAQLDYWVGTGSAFLQFRTVVELDDQGCSQIDLAPTIVMVDDVSLISGMFGGKANGTLPVDELTLSHALDTAAPAVTLVNSTNANGRYRVGDILDVHVVFSKRVTIVLEEPRQDPQLQPQLALFTPHHPNLFAEYSSGNMTTTLHFAFRVPAPQAGQTFNPLLKFDSAGVDSLFGNLRGNRILSGAGEGHVLANLELPLESESYLRHARHIDITFEDVQALRVAAVTPDGEYTLGDTILLEVVFDDRVVVFNPPPVLQLELDNRVASAVYHGGNETKTLLFLYEICAGDATSRLEYLDTRPMLPHHPRSFALSFDQSGRTSPPQLSPSPLDRYSGGVFRATAPDVPVPVHLPLVHSIGSLSKTSDIVIRTSAPSVRAVVAEQPSYVYGKGFVLGMQIHFSDPVVVQGCPRLKMRSNLRTQFATFSPIPNTLDTVVRVAYVVPFGANVAVLDYDGVTALELAPCGQWQTELYIRRRATNLLLNANLTLPPVGPRATVFSPPSISADGLHLQLTPSTVELRQLVDSSDVEQHGPGSVLNVRALFTDFVVATQDSWLMLGGKASTELVARQQWGARQLNNSLQYMAAPLPFQNDGPVTYPDRFAIQPGECVVSDKLGRCVSPIAPWPESVTSAQGRQVVVDSSSLAIIAFSRSGNCCFEGGTTENFSVTFSSGIEVVGGSPELLLLWNGDTAVRLTEWAVTSNYRYHDTLSFEYNIVPTAADGVVELNRVSPLQLNGATIFRRSSFILTQAIMGDVRCLTRAVPAADVSTHRPTVTRVFARKDGVFRPNETVDIIVEFNAAVRLGTSAPSLSLFPGQVRLAICHQVQPGTSTIECSYIVQPGDFASDLDYSSSRALNAGSSDIMSDENPMISADLSLFDHGANGSLARESDVIISSNPIEITAINATASTIPLSPGDAIHFVLVFSQAVKVAGDIVQLQLQISGASGADTRVIALRIQGTVTELSFSYIVQPSDRTGLLFVDRLNGKLVADVSATPVCTTINDAIRPPAAPVDTAIPVVVSVKVAGDLISDHTYSTFDRVFIDVEFSKAVVLNESSASYCLRLQLDNPSSPVCAVYYLGSGNQRIRFLYTIQEGDTADVLTYDGTGALEGAFWCAAEHLLQLADNTLPLPNSLGSLNFGQRTVIQTTTPYVVALFPLTRRGNYVAGEEVVILVRFSKPVTVTGAATLRLRFDNAVGIAEYSGNYSSFSFNPRADIFPTDIFFKYTIEHTVESRDVVHDGPDALQVSDGSIYSVDLNGDIVAPVDLKLREPGDFHWENGRVERQWMSQFPAQIEVILRDVACRSASGLAVKLFHATAASSLFGGESCCAGLQIGKGLSSGSGIVGSTLVFGDTRNVNIARSGMPSQSSTFGNATASRALDGEVNGEYSIARTAGVPDMDPWWQLRFTSPVIVSSIVVWLPPQSNSSVFATQGASPLMRVMLFTDDVEDIPDSIAEAQGLASFTFRIFEGNQQGRHAIIGIPGGAEAAAIRIQQSGASELAIAEVQVYSEQLQLVKAMPQQATLPLRPITAAYQPEREFTGSFQQLPFDGEWLLAIDSSGGSSSGGSISDWLLVVTDYAGLTQVYYMDLQATVYSLPKYGSLASVATADMGNFQELFAEEYDVPLAVAQGMERPLGVCLPDPTTGECTSNFGVPPRMTTRRIGDIAVPQPLREERLVRYTPKYGYLGPDQFTYHAKLSSDSSSTKEVLVEVRVHVRNCRLQQYRESVNERTPPHPICSCKSSPGFAVGNATSCSAAMVSTCADTSQFDVFTGMCTECAKQLSLQGACLREVDRAVRLVETRGLCGSGFGLPACETETSTEPGPEPFIFVKDIDPHFASEITALGNSYGGEGALGTTGLA